MGLFDKFLGNKNERRTQPAVDGFVYTCHYCQESCTTERRDSRARCHCGAYLVVPPRIGLQIRWAADRWAGRLRRAVSFLQRMFDGGQKPQTEIRIAELPIDRCQVRGCLNEAQPLNRQGGLKLCKLHWSEAKNDEGKARKKFDLFTQEELEAQTVNPYPFTKNEMEDENFQYERHHWPSITPSCPKCGSEIQLNQWDLLKDLLGEGSTVVDGNIIPGIVVCCGTCSSFLRARPVESIRRYQNTNPIGRTHYELLELVPRSHVERYPFGCPDCKDKKPVEVRLPDVSLIWPSSYSQSSSKVTVNYSCPCCSAKWEITYCEGSRPTWWKHYYDGSSSTYTIEECETCGTQNSFYASRSGNIRTRICRACGHKEWEETDY